MSRRRHMFSCSRENGPDSLPAHKLCKRSLLSKAACAQELLLKSRVHESREPETALDRSALPMCDYSLHLIASRPAKVADRLVSTDFVKSITRGFTEIGHPDVAVCLLPGTELAFDNEVQFDRAFSMFGKARIEHRVARFRQVHMDSPPVH